MTPKIYLAGPDVFLRDWKERFHALQSLCAKHGMLGLVPSDGGLSHSQSALTLEVARQIYLENADMIARSQGLIANVDSFRGSEPDSGTVFEIGFAVAMNKPVALYSSETTTYAEKVESCFGVDGGYDKFSQARIESFGFTVNLMIHCAAPIFPTPEEALIHLKKYLRK